MKIRRMHHIGPAIPTSALILALALAGCSGDRVGFDWPGSSTASTEAAKPVGAPPVALQGRWLLSSPGRGQCHMTFGSAGAAAIEGTIAPEGGCPGKFYMSRKWTFEGGSLVMRDHNGQTLAQLSSTGATYEGKATGGEVVTLMR